MPRAQQTAKPANSRVSVHFTDIRKSAGITFQQDSTQTDEKYYLETMGTGVAWIDYDHDGLMDLCFVQSGATDAYKPAHPLRSALYHNNGDGTFTDVTYSSGIGNKAMLLSGVAAKFIDYDNDGWPDIVQANGAMLDNVRLYHSLVSYEEPLLMFHNLGSGKFEKSSDTLGGDFNRPVVGRGLATADFLNDGQVGFAVNCRGDYPEVFRNDGASANHWLEVLLIGTKSNRDGIGAVLKLSSSGIVQVDQAKGGTSYMSASDPRIHFGLGKRTKIDSLEITWPSGKVDKLASVPVDSIIAVKEGAGIVPHPFPKVRK